MNPFDRIVEVTALDRPAGAASRIVGRLLANRRVKDVLHGVWLGHPLHPALAQLTLSSFTAASLIDATGGDRRDSSRLIAVGAAAYLPTIAAGWADYSEAHEEQQRLGIVHATLNAAAYTGFVGVLALRARGRSGRLLSVLAGSLSGVAAALGGHLGYRLALGANHSEQVPHVGPGEWQQLGPVADLPDGEPVRRRAGELPVVVLRRDGRVHVLSDTCPHLAGPMSEGEFGADGTIVCPWHGSTFRVADGGVVHGPATAPLPCLQTRVVDGTLQARVRQSAG
jgi:nitrite reductase/ring-hydroxylating ferredoxin subunit